MYKLNHNSTSITRLLDSASIPNDPQNTDYATYLKWLEEGNTPEPAFTEAELAQQVADKAIQDAIKYLKDTDHKMTVDYDKDTTEVKLLRQEARNTIRGVI